MKVLTVATCVLMFWLSSFQASAQNCKPDISQMDKISKQQQDFWFQTIVRSDVAITVWLRSSANGNSVAVQIDKQEAAQTTNTQFQSALRAEKGNQFYFGLKNGEPTAFVATTVENETKVSGSFMAGFSGRNLYTKVVLATSVQAKDLAALRNALSQKQIDAIRIILAGDIRIDKSVNDKDGKKLMEKFACFSQSLDKKPQSIPLEAVPPSDPSILGRYVRKGKNTDYVELKSDGTFSLQQDGKEYSGSYRAQADTITVQVSNGPTSKASISGNTITDSEGIIWEKQTEPQKPAATTQLTIDQIISMVAAKLPDDIIITTIQKTSSKFDLTPDVLIKLKTAGVSDAVIRAMNR